MNKKIKIINVPMGYGAGVGGTEKAPKVLEEFGLYQEISDMGYDLYVEISPVKQYDKDSEYRIPGAKNIDSIILSCESLASIVEDSLNEKSFPLVIGGDHSLLLGSLAGLSSFAMQQDKRLGVLYVDAHGDFNTSETSPTGNIHGESLSASCGVGLTELVNLYKSCQKIKPTNVFILGARDIDSGENILIEEAGVHLYTMEDIYAKGGLINVLDEVFNLICNQCDMVHLSFDIDSVDPVYAPGTGLPVKDGLSPLDVYFIIERLGKTGLLCSADFVEYNPIKDINGMTGKLIIDIIARLLSF